jgi:hypothetical protein
MTTGNEKEKLKKGLWDWFELLSKFMPAILVAIIAFMGNQYLQNKQKADTNLKLYTQLLANKENSENTLRKDMFFEMLKSFLSPEKNGEGGKQTITKIREKLFSLELLARNFHESLDMKPLFKHVLMEIVRPRINLKKQNHQLRRTIGLFELITAFETIPNNKDLSTQEIKDALGKSIANTLQDFYSVSYISEKERKLKDSLEVLKLELTKPGAEINLESKVFIENITNTIDKEALKESFEIIKQSLNIPDTNINDEDNSAKYLLLYMTEKDQFKEMLEKIDPRLFTRTVSSQEGPEGKGVFEKINDSLNQAEFSAEDVKILNEHLIPMIEPQQNLIRRTLSQYDRELDRLISIAKRVTRKQGEVLEDVAGKIRLIIPLQGYASYPICTNVKPTEIDRVAFGFCPQSKETEQRKQGNPVDGITKRGNLFYFDSKGKKEDQSERYFAVTVRYVYPQWKQVFVEITTSPSQNGYILWEKAREDLETQIKKCNEGQLNPDKYQRCLESIFDDLREKYGIQINEAEMSQMTVGEFEKYLKAKLEIDTAKFWLEYFDFPLVDNSYINSKHRYSVVLEGFNSGPDGEDESAEITLLYYPASYAGLKEKSFYNNQLMNTLMKDDFFTGVK